MSGTALNIWSYTDRNHTKIAYQVASSLGGPTETFEDVIEFLKKVPAKELDQYGWAGGDHKTFKIPIGPVIESL